MSLLHDLENMENSSSSHAFPSLIPAQPHRAEILENPLRVSLFDFEKVWQREIRKIKTLSVTGLQVHSNNLTKIKKKKKKTITRYNAYQMRNLKKTFLSRVLHSMIQYIYIFCLYMLKLFQL